jgi:hypothetical protein
MVDFLNEVITKNMRRTRRRKDAIKMSWTLMKDATKLGGLDERET